MDRRLCLTGIAPSPLPEKVWKIYGPGVYRRSILFTDRPYHRCYLFDCCVNNLRHWSNEGGWRRFFKILGRWIRYRSSSGHADQKEKQTREINTGIFCVKTPLLKKFLEALTNDNANEEYYLTDIIKYASNQRFSIDTVSPSLDFEAKGVNSKQQLAELERDYQLESASRLMKAGVTILDPMRIDIRGTLTCDSDVSIDVGCIFEGNVRLGKNVSVESNVIIRDSIVKDNSTIRAFSHVDGASIGSFNDIGPYARIRPGTESQTRVKVGNFVEIKSATLDSDAKANHLSYIGDATIGASVNVGAGTITCNYDGARKHRTVIEDNVFIGSDTQLVAPVTVGAGSTIAAGSTITKDVPSGGLALSRTKQTFIADWKRPTKTTK
jgi:bifunctional UDP-N-acetylglucosamine pyrophosphorylase/glucosamine-1-phosphate N-acetyltransferase